ncbi:MAG: hypothetical protein KDE26_06820 [Bacteroidetes bacterium]|nr:hypothetical protein [Bacteroidota bacterium]
MKTQEGIDVEIDPYNAQIQKSFEIAGRVTRVPEVFLEEIGKHLHTVYLIGETGDLKSAKEMAEAGRAILKAGGTGIKVETAGKAFTAERWNVLLENCSEGDLYEMYVIDSILDEDGSVYSCGMHHLGYKDTIVSGEEFQEAVHLISVFGLYQVMENPEIRHNHTFSTSREAPVFRILDEPDQPYLGDEFFENPFGMWRLQRA